MTTDTRTIAHGRLEEDGDTWFLMRPDRMILLDVTFVVETSLEHNPVSVIGRMGSPSGAPGMTKLLVDRIVPHESVAIRAYDIFTSGASGSRDDHWFQAERELLGQSTA